MKREIKERTRVSGADLKNCGCSENEGIVVTWKTWKLLREEMGCGGGGAVG